jgi:hypothetical protein
MSSTRVFNVYEGSSKLELDFSDVSLQRDVSDYFEFYVQTARDTVVAIVNALGIIGITSSSYKAEFKPGLKVEEGCTWLSASSQTSVVECEVPVFLL